MDYETLIDAETWAFIDRTNGYYPPDATTRTIAEQRRVYDEMCRAFFQGYPEGISATDLEADGVPCRLYSAGDPSVTVVYFHGGGFVVGGLDSHDDICAEICQQTGYRVLAVDYRLAPEHRHPAAFKDAWTATQWAAAEFPEPLVLAGDSAGGTLAAAVVQHMRGKLKRLQGQVLIYPGLGSDLDTASAREHAEAPLLTLDELRFYRRVRTGGEPPADDPTLSPLCDTSFKGLPPTVIFTADCDPLRDDGRLYRDRLREAGVKVAWINEEGLVHGYLRARTSVARARQSFERISLAIEALGQGLWPYS
ncbi:alpha/beta hydrolase [Marinibacterium profundimaris]|uniref:Esterase n=1 Tax=Marinibacterium profundimaris TaxID=1679460 RepID=A0A225NGM8_9RHOB|nr:alpha/beta hydrolase [Marinibacterium profundimaris]OWU72503.1 esterase [Marinibacterium profundimaris]